MYIATDRLVSALSIGSFFGCLIAFLTGIFSPFVTAFFGLIMRQIICDNVGIIVDSHTCADVILFIFAIKL